MISPFQNFQPVWLAPESKLVAPLKSGAVAISTIKWSCGPAELIELDELGMDILWVN